MPEEAAAAELETIRAEMDPELFPVYVKQKLEQTEQLVTGYPSGITCMAVQYLHRELLPVCRS